MCAMRLLMTGLIVACCLGNFMSATGQEKPADPEKLLDQALRLDGKKARALVVKAIQLVGEEKIPANRERLAQRLARALQRTAQTPADLQELMGKTAAWSIARQVYYRRYREQWLLESPVRLVAIFECQQGQEPRMFKVRALPAEQ
jgi:hypothetical protein